MASPGKYPIVLAHGICRFDLLMNTTFRTDQAADDRFHYFRKVGSALRRHGFQAFHSSVSWAGSLERRARELRAELDRITEGFRRFSRVHIIAHSMGGLDARRMICEYQMEHRVASLSTVGTPHLGTSFADWGLRNMHRLIPLAGRIGLDISGFRELTTSACREFNERWEEFERKNAVRYMTYTGVKAREKTFTPLRPSHLIIEREEGPNDGLVSRESAAWRDDLFVTQIEADHLNEIGWWDPRDTETLLNPAAFEERIQEFYLEMARRL